MTRLVCVMRAIQPCKPSRYGKRSPLGTAVDVTPLTLPKGQEVVKDGRHATLGSTLIKTQPARRDVDRPRRRLLRQEAPQEQRGFLVATASSRPLWVINRHRELSVHCPLGARTGHSAHAAPNCGLAFLRTALCCLTGVAIARCRLPTPFPLRAATNSVGQCPHDLTMQVLWRSFPIQMEFQSIDRIAFELR